MKRGLMSRIGALCAFAILPAISLGDVIFETADPFGGPFGILGFDVFEDQSVAQRITPSGTFTLDMVSLWLWNNDASNPQPMTLTVRTDDSSGGGSRPSDVILETWEFELPVTGVFEPMLFDFASVELPLLENGVNYWIAAESPSMAGFDPVWALAAPGSGFMSFAGSDGVWSDGSTSGNTAMTITGTLVDSGPFCEDIEAVRSRCRPDGVIQFQARLFSTAFDGEVLSVQVDDDVFDLTIHGRRASLQVEGQSGTGDHTVELVDPAGCFEAEVVTCE